jgi:DNA-binding Lrp family transcriptional regulator
MEEIHEMTDSEKELLNALGKSPDISIKELLSHTQYKWESTIVRKLERLKKQQILFGPSYYLDCGKLCRNLLYKVFCIMETRQKLETVVSYLKIIRSFAWVFPVLSPRKDMLITGFYSSNNAKMTSLFQLLKDNNIITDYVARASRHKRIMENPNLFGDPRPSLDNLLEPCTIPDSSYGHHSTEWNECDLAVLPYLLMGYKGTRLIEILREEKKLKRTWTYNQVSYSYKKMIENGLIEKEYTVSPFPYNQCAHFILFARPEDTSVTQKILCNFAKGERIYKEHLLFEEWGLVECISHPVFLTDLLYKMDQIDGIKRKELYNVRSIPPEKYWLSCAPEFSYYDFDNQVYEYPYHQYEEKIKEKVESESL